MGHSVFLGALTAGAFESETSPACIVDRAGAIVAVNGAWNRFALANGGMGHVLGPAIEGTAYLSHIEGEEVRRFYRALLETAMDATTAVVQQSECNTTTLRRIVSTRFEPLRSAGGPSRGLLVVSDVVAQGPLEDGLAEPPTSDALVDHAGVIHQCTCCRRAQRPDGPEWVVAPALIAHVDPRASHDVCPVCLDLYYGLP